MSRHRTTARGVLLLVLAAGLAAASATAGTSVTVKQPIVFPVVGPVTYTDDFGQPRPGGPHQGNDLLSPRKAIAVAAEGGTVKFWTASLAAGCMLYLKGDSGTMYEYIHLNNDLTAGNDNRGKCVAGVAYAPELKDGAHVQAGQQVGFVGGSGGMRLLSAYEGQPVVVWTQPAFASLKAERGDDGALTAALVQLG